MCVCVFGKFIYRNIRFMYSNVNLAVQTNIYSSFSLFLSHTHMCRHLPSYLSIIFGKLNVKHEKE